MAEINKVYLSWMDVDDLISCELVPRLQNSHFDVVLAITRGGIVPGGMIAEQLRIQQILVASVDFYKDAEHNLDWPIFMQFPSDSLLRGQEVLIVDDVWYRGREIISVTERVELASGYPTSAVLHYKPKFSQFGERAPEFYAATTDDWIIYPWEVDRSPLRKTTSLPS
jgi:hypoxanthine phosphoribosyltransferase